MSNDAKLIVGFGIVAVAVICSAGIVGTIMIELAGGVREDLHELRDSLERAACGELARQERVEEGGFGVWRLGTASGEGGEDDERVWALERADGGV